MKRRLDVLSVVEVLLGFVAIGVSAALDSLVIATAGGAMLGQGLTMLFVARTIRGFRTWSPGPSSCRSPR